MKFSAIWAIMALSFSTLYADDSKRQGLEVIQTGTRCEVDGATLCTLEIEFEVEGEEASVPLFQFFFEEKEDGSLELMGLVSVFPLFMQDNFQMMLVKKVDGRFQPVTPEVYFENFKNLEVIQTRASELLEKTKKSLADDAERFKKSLQDLKEHLDQLKINDSIERMDLPTGNPDIQMADLSVEAQERVAQKVIQKLEEMIVQQEEQMVQLLLKKASLRKSDSLGQVSAQVLLLEGFEDLGKEGQETAGQVLKSLFDRVKKGDQQTDKIRDSIFDPVQARQGIKIFIQLIEDDHKMLEALKMTLQTQIKALEVVLVAEGKGALEAGDKEIAKETLGLLQSSLKAINSRLSKVKSLQAAYQKIYDQI